MSLCFCQQPNVCVCVCVCVNIILEHQYCPIFINSKFLPESELKVSIIIFTVVDCCWLCYLRDSLLSCKVAHMLWPARYYANIKKMYILSCHQKSMEKLLMSLQEWVKTSLGRMIPCLFSISAILLRRQNTAFRHCILMSSVFHMPGWNTSSPAFHFIWVTLVGSVVLPQYLFFYTKYQVISPWPWSVFCYRNYSCLLIYCVTSMAQDTAILWMAGKETKHFCGYAFSPLLCKTALPVDYIPSLA